VGGVYSLAFGVEMEGEVLVEVAVRLAAPVRLR